MVPILAAAVWQAGACKAELPDQVALDAGLDTPCTVHADQLVAYNPAGSEGGSDIGSRALGPPDGETVPLVANSVLTVAFLGLGGIIDDMNNDDDLAIHGTVSPGSEVAVYVGFGEDQLEFSGSLTPDNLSIDLSTASVSIASFVQLVGISGNASVDAFESLQTVCTN